MNKSNNKIEFLKKIYEWTGHKIMKLLYRGIRDGSKSKSFHEKCDNKAPTVCLYENEKGNIFGGYTTFPWLTPNNETYYPDQNSFMFTLSNIFDIEPTKFQIKNANRSIRQDISQGPTFGGNGGSGNPDIGVYSDFQQSECYSGFPESYQDITGKGFSIFSGINNKHYFKMKEIEVFQMLN